MFDEVNAYFFSLAVLDNGLSNICNNWTTVDINCRKLGQHYLFVRLGPTGQGGDRVSITSVSLRVFVELTPCNT